VADARPVSHQKKSSKGKRLPSLLFFFSLFLALQPLHPLCRFFQGVHCSYSVPRSFLNQLLYLLHVFPPFLVNVDQSYYSSRTSMKVPESACGMWLKPARKRTRFCSPPVFCRNFLDSTRVTPSTYSEPIAEFSHHAKLQACALALIDHRS